MKMKWLGGIILGALVLAGTAQGQAVDVTFSVDMSVQMDLGNFNPDTMGVDVRGSFNNWGNPAATALFREGETGIYSATISVAGAESDPVEYKFVYNNGSDVWENMTDNRSFNLGPSGTAQILDTVYFNNQGPVGPEVTADVTFSVDMGVQIVLGNFDPDTGEVQIRGPFNEWGGTALTQVGETTVYSATLSVTANEGSDVPHKFYIVGFLDPNDGYETGNDRTFVMGEHGVPLVLDTVYFSNQAPASGLNLDGTWNPAAIGDYAFTLTRSDPGIGDVINLSSDNELAASVPATVTFGAGLDEATFFVEVISLVGGDATLTAVDPISGDSAEFTVRMPRMEIDGPWQVYAMGPVTYTLRRFNNVPDTVNLASFDPAVMSVPATATFQVGVDETTFDATALDYGGTVLSATDPANGVNVEFGVSVQTASLELSGPVFAWTGFNPTFTLTRYGPIGDLVNLSSTEPAVLLVPASVSFAFDADTVTFQAQALTPGMASINAQNDDATADPLPVLVEESPAFVAYDDASLYADGVWTLTPAHDSGFSDWAEELTPPDPAPEGVFRGSFIDSSAIPGMNEAGASFGLFANWSGSEPAPLPEVKLSRGFPGPMMPGQIFSVDVGYDWSSGTKGFKLQGDFEGTAYDRFELFNSGGNTWSYKLDGDDDTITVVWDGYISGGFKGTVQAESTAPNTFTFTFVRDGDVEPTVVPGIVLPGTIDQIQFYNYNGGAGDEENLYFNRMWLTEAGDPDPALEFIGGTWDVTVVGPYEYTIRRTGLVEDEITLTSDNPLAVTVPATVTFGVGETEVSFMAEVIALNQGNATIEAWDPVSGAMADYIVQPRDVGPMAGQLTYVSATGEMSFTVPPGYQLGTIEWSDSSLVDGDWVWEPIPQGLYSVSEGVVTILTNDGASPERMIIRVWFGSSSPI